MVTPWWHARSVHCLEADLEELFSIFRLPPAQRRRLRTTNVIERLFVEVRRRVRTMCAFTTRDSCERILLQCLLSNEPILGQTPFYTKFVTLPG